MKEMVYRPLREWETLYDSCQILDENRYNSYHYIIVSYGAHPCAYVELPKEHGLYGRDVYKFDDFPIECHGGITYSSGKEGLFPLEHPCHRDGYWIGWDYNHYKDYHAYDIDPAKADRIFRCDKKWTTEEILEEVKNVIDQLGEATSNQQ